MQSFDLAAHGLRALNSTLHGLRGQTNETEWEILNPRGAHAIAAGVDAPVDITVRGSTGYYCAGMNKRALWSSTATPRNMPGLPGAAGC
jgi:glutamate synthase domain-containing protein 3